MGTLRLETDLLAPMTMWQIVSNTLVLQVLRVSELFAQEHSDVADGISAPLPPLLSTITSFFLHFFPTQ